MNSNKNTILTAIVVVLVICCVYTVYKNTIEEGYKDPIWMNRTKLYSDQYPRANGSIYGNCRQPWDMFSGFPLYPTAQ